MMYTSRQRRHGRLIFTIWLTIALGAVVLGTTVSAQTDDLSSQLLGSDVVSRLAKLRDAAIALPLAAALGAALALRPRRKGTPPRSAAVVQTQVILALIGALVMLIVGASLARAFGVVGVAGLIRYRAKINDPKDAGVMLSTLAIGLACGVGLYLISTFAAAFILVVVWVLESVEPNPRKNFTLKVTKKDIAKVQPRIEQMLLRQEARFELRTSGPDELHYDVSLPVDVRTDRLSNSILRLDETEGATVEWDDKRTKKEAA
jgi:uncharacterized membrane protein YhiD involved in acid resistance